MTYYTNNQHRIDYPTCRAQGDQIGSGTIESSIKQIVTQRMKVTGARWNFDNARRVAKARAAFLSGQWHKLATSHTWGLNFVSQFVRTPLFLFLEKFESPLCYNGQSGVLCAFLMNFEPWQKKIWIKPFTPSNTIHWLLDQT